jgi:hypothetical protein
VIIMMRRIVAAGAFAAFVALAGIAHATIVATSGDVVLAVPADVRLGQTQSDLRIVAFQERGCFQLPNALATDQGGLAAGTWVQPHFLHADPVTNAVLQGRVRFANNILGVISSSAGLDASAVCQRPGTTYPAAGAEPNRGLDAATPLDDYMLLSPTELQVRMDIPSFSDQMRVLTSCGD